MPKIGGERKETFHNLLYSAWIADTRPDGMGVSKWSVMRAHPEHRQPSIRLFMGDLGDHSRTNMHCAGCLPGDQTIRIERVGLYAAFSDERRYAEFFRCARMILTVGDKPMLTVPASYFASGDVVQPEQVVVEDGKVPPPFLHSEGFCGFVKFDKGIAVPPRQCFEAHVDLHDVAFAEYLERLERGGEFTSYAQIMLMIEGPQSRSIL